ncbi:MAG: ExbD/TolR family protein [Erythrobacter sp.]
MGMGVSSSAGRSRRGRRRGAMSEINVTPLVDVMLVLLIIFMVTVTLPAVGVPLELPESRANPVEEAPNQVTISIDAAGTIFVEDDPVAAGGLPEALAQLGRDGEGRLPVIVLRGDRSLDYGRVMAVMGELGRAGFTSISLVTSGSVTAP